MTGGYFSCDKTVSSTGVEPLVRLWLLRLLVPLEASKRCFNHEPRFMHEIGYEVFNSLVAIFNIDMECCKSLDNQIDHGKALMCLRKLYESSEKR